MFSISVRSRGQLGQGETNTEDVPVLLEALAGIKVVQHRTCTGLGVHNPIK